MAEAVRQVIERDLYKDVRFNTASNVGERALWGAGVFRRELGVNDPLTHLEQYLETGEESINSIEEDLITDLAERMEKPHFINTVIFDRHDNDFVSRENKFSMRSMTNITENKFANNIADIRLYQRAKIEAKEVDRLNEWFDSAHVDDVFIAESMPLTENESYTIVRFHQKINEQVLAEHILALHNSTTDLFNELHTRIGADVPKSETVLELLDNMYAHRPARYQNFEEFLNRYIATYDEVLAERNPDKVFRFGLEGLEVPYLRDDIVLVRDQQTLRSIYTDSIKALGKSGGKVTADVLRVNNELKLRTDLTLGMTISSNAARKFLDSSLQYIAATLNRASEADLEVLAIGSRDNVVESASYYGSAARDEGIRYEGACPSGSSEAAAEEAAILAQSRRVNLSPECVFCPKCQKTVDADKEYFKKGWWHCPDCKSTAPRHGVRQQSLTKKNRPKNPTFFEVISAELTRYEQERKAKAAIKKQQAELKEAA